MENQLGKLRSKMNEEVVRPKSKEIISQQQQSHEGTSMSSKDMSAPGNKKNVLSFGKAFAKTYKHELQRSSVPNKFKRKRTKFVVDVEDSGCSAHSDEVYAQTDKKIQKQVTAKMQERYRQLCNEDDGDGDHETREHYKKVIQDKLERRKRDLSFE